MEQEKSDATLGEVRKHVTVRISWGNKLKDTDIREIGWATFTVVYTQESIRVLDLRLNIPELDNPAALGELLRAAARAIFIRVVEEALND